MQKTFLSNLSLLMVLNLLIKPAYLLLVEAEVQNRVGSEVFGHYSALLSLGFLLNIVLDLGINTFTSRELSRRNDVVSNYFSGVVLLRLLLAGVYFAVLTVLAMVLGEDDVVGLDWGQPVVGGQRAVHPIEFEWPAFVQARCSTVGA